MIDLLLITNFKKIKKCLISWTNLGLKEWTSHLRHTYEFGMIELFPIDLFNFWD